MTSFSSPKDHYCVYHSRSCPVLNICKGASFYTVLAFYGEAEYLVVFGEEYVGDALNVYAEGEAYVIMDGDKKIGKVTTFDRKFDVVLRFY